MNEMASTNGCDCHSIMKKDGITHRAKKVRFHTTTPDKPQLIRAAGKKRPMDINAQTVCKSAKKKRRRKKEAAWRDTELSEDELIAASTTASQEYEVEAILDHKKHGADYLYLLKWKGYAEEENSWEPSSNLAGCDYLLKTYKKRHNLDPPQSLDREELYQCHFMEGDSRKLVFKKTNQEILETSQGKAEEEWNVEVNRRMKRLGKLKRTKKKQRSLIVSIKLCNGVRVPAADDQISRESSTSCIQDLSDHDHHSYPPQSQDVNETPSTHSSCLVWHDHGYCKQDTGQHPSPTRQPHAPMLTPPSSAEPELSSSSSSSSSSTYPPSDTIQSSHATTQPFCVHIQSPPPSPGPTSPPISPGHSHNSKTDPLCRPMAPPSPIQAIHDTDSDSQQSTAEVPGSSLLLHLSSTSSASSDVDTCDKDDSDTTSLTTKPRNGHNPSEQLKSVLTRTCRVEKKPYSHPRYGSLLSKWHKGPLPLPKSFSMRQSNGSTLPTKAAKLQLGSNLPTLALVSRNEQDNGRSQGVCGKPMVNGLQLPKPHSKLSLSLKKRLIVNGGSLEQEGAKDGKKVRKVLARSTSENSVVVSSPVATTPPSYKVPSVQSARLKCSHGDKSDHSDKLCKKLESVGLNHCGSLKSNCNGKSRFNHNAKSMSRSDSSVKKKSSHNDKPKSNPDDRPRSDNDAESSTSSSADDQVSKYAYKEILMNWQYELNKQRAGTDDIIYVENDVDMELPPSDFIYTSSNIYTPEVPNPSSNDIVNSLCGCECYYLGRKCGPRSEYCCAHMAGSKFAYTVAGKVRVQPGTPIYECNPKCSCPSDCTNRVVQLGRKIPLCIFRTANRGWGVKTIEPIKPNTFITEYVGEVISNEEAERRGKKCDARGITYLFDLDFEDDNSAFTIDAARYGNISHFFNHSCDPNLVVYSVWIDTLDKRLPRLAFFTTRSISIGEELTFDYQMNGNCDHGGGGCGPKVPCLCGSKNCLGYMY